MKKQFRAGMRNQKITYVSPQLMLILIAVSLAIFAYVTKDYHVCSKISK